MPIFAVLLTCIMITVILADLTRYIIPNWLVGIVLLLYPVMVCFAPVATRPDWKMALLIGLGVFAVGFLLFTLRAMGGGDIKLLTALSLWTGTAGTIEFCIWVSILGGLFAVALLLVRALIPHALRKLKKSPALPRVLKTGEPVPYGVAIAVAFLMLLWAGGIAGVRV